MNRPSHWILALFAVIGPALWIWGLSEGFPARTDPDPGTRQAVAVRLRSTPPAAPVPQGTLTGRIIDELGTPLDLARIRVLGGRGAAVTRQGGFEVPVQLAEPYLRVEVAADGFAPAVTRCAASDAASLVVSLRRALPFAPTPSVPNPGKRPALAGHGFVFDQDRRPVAGAAVVVLETGDSVFTDEGGKYRIPIPLERATLAITHADGRAAVTETFEYAQPEGLVGLGERMLTRGARVQGTVQLPDGAPAVAAAVVLRHQGLVRRVLTGGDGTFAVDGLIAVDYELEVLPVPGCMPLVHTLAVSGSGQLRSELRLVAEVPLRVRVVDEHDAPRTSSFVVARDAGDHVAWAQTDADGVAVLRGFATGEVTFDEVRSAQHALLEVLRVESVGGAPKLVTKL